MSGEARLCAFYHRVGRRRGCTRPDCRFVHSVEARVNALLDSPGDEARAIAALLAAAGQAEPAELLAEQAGRAGRAELLAELEAEHAEQAEQAALLAELEAELARWRAGPDEACAAPTASGRAAVVFPHRALEAFEQRRLLEEAQGAGAQGAERAEQGVGAQGAERAERSA